MDAIVFITMLAWAATILGGITTAMSVYTWYYYECTRAGEFEQRLMRAGGQRIVGFYFWPRFIIFIVGVAVLVAVY